MKKIIVTLTIAAFAIAPATFADEAKKTCDGKKACCAASAKKMSCSAKGACSSEGVSKQALLTPKSKQ